MRTTQFDMKHLLTVQRRTFLVMGIDVTSLERTIKQPLKFGFLSLTCGLFFLATLHYYWVTSYDNIDELTFDFLPLVQYMTISSKISIFVYKRKEFVKLVQRIHLMTKQASSEERLLIDTANKTDKMLCGSYYIMVMTFFGIICFIPPVISLVVYLDHGNLRSFIPMKFSNPLNESQPVTFILTNIWETLSIYYCAHVTSSLDASYAGLVHNIVAQFRVLQCKFRNAALETDTVKMKAAILTSIQHHRNTIALADDLNDIYKTIIFVEFSLNSLPICLLGYQFGNGIPGEYLPFIIAYLIAIFCQLMIYIYGGQRIQDESTIVSTHIYEMFPWERLEVRVQKLLMLSMMRAQKCCTITGYFFIADWKLFVWVVKSSYSMVALLRSMKVDDDP